MNKRYQQLVRRGIALKRAPSDLQEIADHIRNVYASRRRDMLGLYIPSKKHDMEWLEAAVACIEAGAGPVEWVTAQLDTPGFIAYPNNLHGENATQRYKNWLAASDYRTVKLELVSFIDILKTFKQTSSVRDVLLDEKHGFPPLFVYCIARLAGMNDLADMHLARAKEFITNPSYRKVYCEYFNDVVGNL